MKYTGRISLVALSLSVSLVEFVLGRDTNVSEFYFDFTFAVIAWYVGGLYDKSIFLSFNDSLTKVYNRRYADKVIPKLIRKAKIKQESVSVFSLDVNNFKSLNDTFGHQMGDRALKKLSHILLSNVRKEDMVFRWGGDEFLIVAPNTDKSFVNNLITQINHAVELEVKKFKNQDIKLGISIGYAEFPTDGQTFDEILSKADKKMYKVKITSKNEDKKIIS